MFPAKPFAALLVALTALIGSGCTHLAPVTETTDARGHTVYSSTLRYADGTPRTMVDETVLGSDDTCDILRVERRFFDPEGVLVERTVDRERCRVVEHRVTERYDVLAAKATTVVARDSDRDGNFDELVTKSHTMSEGELAMLVTH